MQLRPGALIVLEGLDKTGKTTQRDRLASLPWADPAPIVTHMPSGLTPVTEAIYQLTEQHSISSPLARQLLHLACHAENVPQLLRAHSVQGVFIDRWWWSTVAYGWFGAGLRSELDEATFLAVISMIWSGLPADLVFLFLAPHGHDVLNEPAVTQGYRWLASRYHQIAIEVPHADPDATTAFLLRQMRERALVRA
jgi:dTMP kinase